MLGDKHRIIHVIRVTGCDSEDFRYCVMKVV